MSLEPVPVTFLVALPLSGACWRIGRPDCSPDYKRPARRAEQIGEHQTRKHHLRRLESDCKRGRCKRVSIPSHSRGRRCPAVRRLRRTRVAHGFAIVPGIGAAASTLRVDLIDLILRNDGGARIQLLLCRRERRRVQAVVSVLRERLPGFIGRLADRLPDCPARPSEVGAAPPGADPHSGSWLGPAGWPLC